MSPFLAVDRAQILEGHRAAGVGRQGLHGVLPGLRQVAQLQVGDPQGHAGVGVLRRDLQAAKQQLYGPVELAGCEELGRGRGLEITFSVAYNIIILVRN